MPSIVTRGTWVPIDRHAKLRRFVNVRDGDQWSLARWSKLDAAWLDGTTLKPLAFTPTEYLRP